VHRLAHDLLLVFKPAGHEEGWHAHAKRQRLRVLRGMLEVRTGRRTIVLDSEGGPLTLRAGQRHRTLALADTWVLAEYL
jgi:quercetin dioxygenase-like cupin family protein